MKILMVSLDNVNKVMGGLGVHVRELGQALVKLGHEVTILGMDPMGSEYFNDTVKGVKIINCENTAGHIFRKGLGKLFTEMNVMTENFCHHLGREKFDIVAVHDSKYFEIAKNAAVLNKCPLVLTSHLSFILGSGGTENNDGFIYEAQQELNAHRLSHQTISVSDHYRAELLKNGIAREDIKTIPNGINMDEFKNVKADLEFKKRLTNNTRKLAGFVGRCSPTKGLDLIIDVAERAPKDWHFLLISYMAPDYKMDNPVSARLEKYCETHDNLYWISDMSSEDPKKLEYLKACDVGLVPSLHEPWGIVTDELALLGVEKIVTRVGGLPEHNFEDDSILIDTDSEELYQALVNYKKDESKIRLSYERAAKRTWKECARRHEEIYKWLVNLYN